MFACHVPFPSYAFFVDIPPIPHPALLLLWSHPPPSGKHQKPGTGCGTLKLFIGTLTLNNHWIINTQLLLIPSPTSLDLFRGLHMADVDAEAERLRYDRSSADRKAGWKVPPALTPHMSHGKDHDAFALAVRLGKTAQIRHAFALKSHPTLLRNIGEYLSNSAGEWVSRSPSLSSSL